MLNLKYRFSYCYLFRPIVKRYRYNSGRYKKHFQGKELAYENLSPTHINKPFEAIVVII
jgi:hypothetical protein